MMEKSFKYDWQPHIVAIGKPAGALKTFRTSNNRLQIRAKQEPDKIVVTSPSTISCSNSILSVIDQKGSLWIVGNIFYEPVNISDIVRIKAKKVFLGEGQLLFETKRKSMVLVTWGSKPEFKNQKLRKINISGGQYSHLIEAFFVEENIEQESLWYYSTANKLEYTVKLYLLNVISQEIVGFPSGKKIKVPSRPAGMSLGRYHGLVWTEDGRIFSWGCKNLGLGLKVYTKSFYEDLQEIQLPEPIVKACALTSYSFALGSSGLLYEWGIKSNGEPQLTPKVLYMSGLSFIDIKNTDQCIAGLSSTNELYLWGKGVSQIIGEDKKATPYQIPKDQSTKITDFQLQESFIILMLTHNKGDLSNQERKYFNQVLSKVTNKWFPHKAKSKPLAKQSKHKYLTPTCTPPSAKQNEDFIDRLVDEKMSKDTYFCQLQNQEELFKNLMNTSPHHFVYHQTSGKPLVTSRQPFKHNRTHKKVQSTRETCNIAFDFQNANRILKEFDDQRNRFKGKGRRLGTASSTNHKLSSYDERKQAAAQRREEIMKSKASSAVSKRRTMVRSEPVKQLEQEDYIRDFQNNLIKAYIIKLIKEPLLYAKHIKLKQRRSQQTFNRIASNMKNILGRQRAIHFLKLLQEEHPQRYELMKRIIGGAMRRWKENKIISIRNTIVSNLVLSTLKKKISHGLGKVWLKARKIGKCAKWLVNDNHQRYSQLRSLWKKTLLLYIKPTPSFENKNPSSCREELNLKTLSQKAKCPKLSTFLHKSAIFVLKLLFPVPLVCLQETKQMCQFTQPQFHTTVSIKKGVSWGENSRLDWKSSTLQRDEKKSTHFAHNGMIDILLYSHHYDFFFKPKNYQLNIPDNMKLSEDWVTAQKTIFENVLKGIMHEQWKSFWFSRIQYQMKLALFIRDNYDYLAEFRWKYILQYNQTKNVTSVENHRKQRQLNRILRLVGAEAILAKDVIPEKHRTLDFVSKLKGAPVAPVYQTYLGNSLFKKQFKNYYEEVIAKAKQTRRFFS